MDHMDWTLQTDLWKSETSRDIKNGYLNVKIKMGVAGLIFEPHPPNFENQYNFWRCSNDAKIFFLT